MPIVTTNCPRYDHVCPVPTKLLLLSRERRTVSPNFLALYYLKKRGKTSEETFQMRYRTNNPKNDRSHNRQASTGRGRRSQPRPPLQTSARQTEKGEEKGNPLTQHVRPKEQPPQQVSSARRRQPTKVLQALRQVPTAAKAGWTRACDEPASRAPASHPEPRSTQALSLSLSALPQRTPAGEAESSTSLHTLRSTNWERFWDTTGILLAHRFFLPDRDHRPRRLSEPPRINHGRLRDFCFDFRLTYGYPWMD